MKNYLIPKIAYIFYLGTNYYDVGGIIFILFLHNRTMKSKTNIVIAAPGSSVSANSDERMRSPNPCDFFLNISSYHLL